ncbi:HRDC domain-containing protein [Methanosarcina sp. T3]|uniref:HRDC domain-containing protein n=1 Tax=Methanosarcina sp. T3 TaxID=3439062 RepID=UPI003F85C383
MAEFLDTEGTTHHLTKIIKNARQEVFIISPYLKINHKLKDLIEDKDRMKINITIVYGKNELQPDENNWLKQLNSVRTGFCKDLHAKCYLNESEAIVTSMNLYEYSQVNNYEMGIYVAKDEDPKLYSDIYDEARRLFRISEEIKVTVEKIVPRDSEIDDRVSRSIEPSKVNEQWKTEEKIESEKEIASYDSSSSDLNLFERLRILRSKVAEQENVPAYYIFTDKTLEEICSKVPKNSNEFLSITGVGQKKLERYGSVFLREIANYSKQDLINDSGSCIRCGEKIRYNPDEPFCIDCYNSWARFGNPKYKEKFCHKCGKPVDTSKEKPVCYQCFKNGL